MGTKSASQIDRKHRIILSKQDCELDETDLAIKKALPRKRDRKAMEKWTAQELAQLFQGLEEHKNDLKKLDGCVPTKN